MLKSFKKKIAYLIFDDSPSVTEEQRAEYKKVYDNCKSMYDEIRMIKHTTQAQFIHRIESVTGITESSRGGTYISSGIACALPNILCDLKDSRISIYIIGDGENWIEDNEKVISTIEFLKNKGVEVNFVEVFPEDNMDTIAFVVDSYWKMKYRETLKNNILTISKPANKQEDIRIHVRTKNKKTEARVEIDGKISIGEANCNEIDTYDRNEGIRIAVTRALGIDPFDVSTKPKEELEVKRIPLYMQLNEMQKSIGAMGGRILKAHSVTSNPKLPAFDWNKFKGRFQRVAVNCKNKKEAEDFLRACGKHGIKAHENYGDLITWNERRVLSKVANCFIYDSRDGLLYFGSDSYFIGNGYEVLNWSDYQSAESDAQSLADILSEI